MHATPQGIVADRPDLVRPAPGGDTQSSFPSGAVAASETLSVCASIRRILIVKADRMYGELLRQFVQPFCTAAIVTLATTVADADEAFRRAPPDLVITGVVAGDGNTLDHLPRWAVTRSRALVITARREPAVLHELAELSVGGVIDQRGEGVGELERALVAIANGFAYWSPSLRLALTEECRTYKSRFGSLTPTERLVLGIIGDGCDNIRAGDQLQMSAESVKAVRKALHRKLGAQHRGELVDRAAELGFVIRTPFGLFRPGFNRLYAERRLRQQTAALAGSSRSAA